MPTFTIQKDGQLYQKTADTREEAIAAVEAAAQNRKEQFDLADAQLDAMDGPQVAPQAEERSEIDTTFGEKLDAVTTMISGAGGSLIGHTFGLAKGLTKAVQDGTYGTQAGVKTVRDNVDEVTDTFSKDPYTEGGREILTRVGETLEPVTDVLTDPTKLGFVQALPGMHQPITRIPGAFTSAAIKESAKQAGKAVVDDVANAGRAALSPVTVPARTLRDRAWQPEANTRSVGAAETSKAREINTTAENLPVPMTGESGLTRGQLTRQNEQIAWEREAAKRDGSVGRMFQERGQNQQRVMHQNFDELDEQIGGPGQVVDSEQGQGLRNAVTDYRSQRKKQKDDAYKAAQRAGETNALVNPDGLHGEFQRLWHDSGIVPKNKAMIAEAQRLNILDEQGRLKPTTVDNLVKLRQFANRGYSGADPTETYQRRQLLNAIDASLNNTDAGPIYAQARRVASEYYDEFDNSPLASGLNKNKRGSNVEQIADEKVVSRITGSSIQEIKQIERTLNATPEGQRQWKGVQSRFLEQIKEKAFGVQTDSTRQPLLNPGQFKKYVVGLDRSGKLEAILGKKMAQDLRDMVEVSDSIATAPPGTVNHSNSSSAIWNFLSQNAGLVNPKNMIIGHFYKQGRDAVKAKRSLDGQSLLEGL